MEELNYKLISNNILAAKHNIDKNGMITVRTASHGNCGNRCLINVTIKNDRLIGIRQDTEPMTAVPPCAKGYQYLSTFTNKARLLRPMKRVGERGEGKFTAITWTEALHTIAEQMTRIKNKYGAASRYCNYATGYEMCCLTPATMIKRLLALDGGYLDYYNNYSNSPTTIASRLTYGTDFTGNSRNDYVNSKLILLWGYNPAETACGGNTMLSLKRAKEAGTRIIVIDARFSDTAAAIADQWIAPLPTTDSALADAMAYVIYKENLHDQGFLDRFCIGFDEKTLPEVAPQDSSYLAYLLGQNDGIVKTPAWASSICSIPEEVIYQLAITYATAKPAAILEGYGPGRHANGEQFSRGLMTLACITGNIGIPGGGAAGAGQVPYSTHLLPDLPPKIKNPYPGKIPCYTWTSAAADATSVTYDDGLKGVSALASEIKLIFNLAGNCLINQHGDCNRTAALLKDTSKVEFIVCSDIFMTSSAKFADILLPGTTMFETENITASAARFDHFFKINPIMEPPGECRFDYDWICELADILGWGKQFHENKSAHQWLLQCISMLQEKLPDFPSMDDFTRSGIYKRSENKKIIAFKDEVEKPDQHPFSTPSGKIELFIASIYEKKDPHQSAIPRYIQAPEGPFDTGYQAYPLQCIGYHTKARTHSIHDNNEFLSKTFPHEVWLNPMDARQRNIKNGDLVAVFNERGTIQITAHVTSRIRPGVTAISQGAWFTPNSAGIDQRGCINTLTSWRTTPIAKANAQHTNRIEIKHLASKNNTAHFGTVNNNASTNDTAADRLYYCTGCKTCISACIEQNRGKVPHMRVYEITTVAPNKPVHYKPVPCGKCKAPACALACPMRIL